MMRSSLVRLWRAAAPAASSASAASASALLPAASVSGRGLASSAGAAAAPATAVAVEGDVDGFLRDVVGVIDSDACGAKDVADAALALTYLQAKGNRRVWGKVMEKASAVKASFDPATLSTFLWSVATSNVAHFKTTYELVGPAEAHLKAFTPAQLSFVVEALGKAGVNDVELFKQAAARVLAKPADFKPAELSRILWGFAAAGQHDAKLVKAAVKAITEKGDAAAARDLVQVVAAHAAMGRADKAVLDAACKALKGKLDKPEHVTDAAGLVAALASLAYPPDAELLAKASALVKAGAGELSTAQQIQTAWGMATLGAADKEALGALLAAAAAAVAKAPEAVSIADVALLAEAALMSADKGGPKVPEQVLTYALHVHALARDGAALRRSKPAADFRADVAAATATALGARYKPDVAKMVAAFGKTTADGLAVELGAEVDKDVKVAVECLESGAPAGAAAARARLLEARGYKVVTVRQGEWAGLADAKAKAGFLLNAIKAAAPAAAGKVAALAKELEKPFDVYAE